jgi:hypothetical protein
MITYAQNFEDVTIARLFAADHRGFYVDIGAADPALLSVTCHFYNQGRSGINVEPSSHFFPLLRKARPRGINLQCAVGTAIGKKIDRGDPVDMEARRIAHAGRRTAPGKSYGHPLCTASQST